MIQGCSLELFIIRVQICFRYDCNVITIRKTRDKHKTRVLHTGDDKLRWYSLLRYENIIIRRRHILWKVDEKKNEEGSTDFTPTSTKVVQSTVFRSQEKYNKSVRFTSFHTERHKKVSKSVFSWRTRMSPDIQHGMFPTGSTSSMFAPSLVLTQTTKAI